MKKYNVELIETLRLYIDKIEKYSLVSCNNKKYLEKKIEQNTKRFLHKVDKADAESDISKRLKYAQNAARYATEHAIALYANSKLENIFTSIAQQNHVETSETFEKNSFLHVMTEAYPHGGHTRCVERWIELRNQNEKHSCILLEQIAKWPQKLRVLAEASGGEFVIYNRQKTLLDRAMMLRCEASKFQYIIVHTHPHDPIPLLAFGSKEFWRPVILFNHANHMFWLGISIADCVADLGAILRENTLKKRKAKCAFNLGIPPDITISNRLQNQYAPKKQQKKVIFASGSQYKFSTIDNNNFFDTIDFLLASNIDYNFVIVGLTPNNNKALKTIAQKYCGRVFCHNYLDYQTEYKNLLKQADLVLDSYPVGGATAVIDAVCMGKPVLTLNKYQNNFLMKTEGTCSTVEEFRNKSLGILNDCEYGSKINFEEYQSLIKHNSPQEWKTRLNDLLQILPKKHELNIITEDTSEYRVEQEHIDVCRWIQADITDVFSIKNVINFFLVPRRLLWNSTRGTKAP